LRDPKIFKQLMSSSFPLLNLQKICPHKYPHSSCANQLIFMVSGIPTLDRSGTWYKSGMGTTTLPPQSEG
jgi:hypothetical protein